MKKITRPPLDERVSQWLHSRGRRGAKDGWRAIIKDYGDEGLRWLGANDRFFLLTQLLHRKDADKQWLYERCREVEECPDDHLDLWARP